MSPLRNRSARGFLLLELAIALLVIGGLVAVTLPLWNMQAERETAQQDILRLQEASEALLRQAIVGSGLPAPLKFLEAAAGGGTASSHGEIDPSLTPLAAGWPGALPGSLLGVATVSPLQTAYWYDVQPALRGDAATGFYPTSQQISGVWSFDPIIAQFNPDLNTRLSSGANPSQLCRNLNTLQALEQNIRVHTTGSTALYSRDHINLTLPRIWATGYESQFEWNSAFGYASVTSAGVALDNAFDNSSAAAFVVVRRQPPALRRLDRQNAVYAQAGLSGLDPALADRGYEESPRQSYPLAAAERGFRIYENPLTPSSDDPNSDLQDYAGRVQAVSLGAFADALRQAGMCKAPAEACKAHQVFVRLSNSALTAPLSGTAQGLTLRWQLVDQPIASVPQTYTVLNAGVVDSGSTSDGVCLDAFGTDVATEAPNRYLRIFFGANGYTDGGDYWYRNGLLVDPDQGLPASDAGVSRWLNLSALSAAKGGQTATVSCSGTHTVSAAGELVRPNSGTLSCAVTQSP